MKNSFDKILVNFLLTLSFYYIFVTISYATPASDLSTLLNSVHSMQSQFSQTIFDSKGKVVQKSQGRMAFDRPGKFRWQVTKPIPQTIIANDKRIWIYDPDLQQVTIRALQRTTGETPALFLSHSDATLESDYKVQELPQKGKARAFLLAARKEDAMFTSVQMAFTGDQIHEMQLQDHLGHKTVVKFENTKTNVSLSPTLFIFKAPAKVDVIDETRKK